MLRSSLASIYEMLPTTLNYTLVVGAVASVLDWCTLVLLVKGFHLSPQMANFPSLLVGSCIQFVGNRNFVFKATQRSAGKQAVEFTMVEFFAFLLNGSIFQILVTWTPINYAVARPLGSFAVFLCFSYPLWKLVFRKIDAGQKPLK